MIVPVECLQNPRPNFSTKIPLGRRASKKLPVGFQVSSEIVKARAADIIYSPAEKHLLTIAPTGAGKFRSMLGPELLTYPGPIVCLDVKGEAYAVTARRRREMGQRVVRLDPFQVIGPGSDSLNFFDLFSLPGSDLETDAQMLSTIISDGAVLSRDPFWDVSGRGLVTGLIVFLAKHREKKSQVLHSLRELLYSDDTDYSLAVLLDTIKPMHSLAHGEIAAYLSQAERETRPSVLATARSYFKAFFSERIESTFGESTFPLASITDAEPVTIYLVIPPNKLESHRRLVRVWMATLMAAITTRRQIPQMPTLFLVDEASQLGNFPPLMQAITLGRGYGVRVHSFWQDLSQLSHAYPTEWRTMVNNCSVKQTFGLTDPFMAAGLDELFNVSVNDLTRLGRNEQYLARSGEPTKAAKLDYLKDAEFKSMFDANPYHGGDWPKLSHESFCLTETEELSLRAIAQRGRPNDNDALEHGVPNV